MYRRTGVNSQITDALTQASLATVGMGPALATGMHQQAGAHAMATMMLNGAMAQGQNAMLTQAAAVRGVMGMYGGRGRSRARPADDGNRLLTLLLLAVLVNQGRPAGG